MRIPVKLLIIFQIILFVSFSNTSLEAETLFESFGVGLPAVNVSDTPEGETTYSLSLQILALMTVLTVLPSLILGMTSFHSNYHCFINITSGNGYSADTSKSSFDCCCTFFNAFYYDPYSF